jgi:L-asparaginase / beta-aspartyl-peptidase
MPAFLFVTCVAMKRVILLIMLTCFGLHAHAQQSGIVATRDCKYALVIHGGAGSMAKENMTPAKEKAYTDGLQRALTIGYNMLIRGKTAVEVAEAVVMVMEGDSLFNAGKGAVFANNGRNELDASIMDGRTLRAGAVAGVTTIRNPVNAARMVMEESGHVMLSGKGAEEFAAQKGCAMVHPSYFFTQEKWDAYKMAKAKDSLNDLQKKKTGIEPPVNPDEKYGTVGAVVMDIYGNLAAATSTGGMTNKKWGRVGDSPIIGAGTYADNNTCAISCTGWGEYFIRLGMAKAVSDRMELKGMSLKDAANDMIMTRLPVLGGDGGLIGVDKNGNITAPFCTAGMYRAWITSGGDKVVKIYKD